MTTFKRKIIDWSATLVLVIIPILVLRASLARGTPSALDEALLRITAPLQAGVSWIVEGVGGMWGRYVSLIDVEAENRELRAENDKLRRELATMSRRAFDVAALEDLAVVKRRTPADTLGARVIGAPMSPQFRVMRLRIDRGDKDVQPGMPVITGTGPVGRINKVFGDYADVTLISDASSAVEVVIPRTGGRGILRGLGRADSYACTIEWLERQAAAATTPTATPPPPPLPGLGTAAGSAAPSAEARPADTRLQVGDEVVTSGLGASFPPGLVVGKVTSIGKDDGMFQSVEVRPAVDVSRVRAVEVLLAPPPPPDPDAKTKRKSEPAFGGRPL
jgi:rod shape-determining protein MreC